MSALEETLAALETMPPDRLRAQWLQLGVGPLPQVSPSLLRMALAWELQAKALGGLPRATRTKLDQLAGGKTRTVAAPASTRLVREWGGKVHIVTIDQDKVIHWEDRSWNSLSEVARAITGTRWSGPAFFGLKKRIAA